jgi:hypothetical protein
MAVDPLRINLFEIGISRIGVDQIFSLTHLLQWLKYSALKSAGYRQGREAWHYTSTGEL